jgi:hypothetical protein
MASPVTEIEAWNRRLTQINADGAFDMTSANRIK